MPVWQAVERVARVIGETNTADSFPEARRQIRQAAADGRIDVWGQKDIPPAHFQDDRHSSIWTPIEAGYWHDHELNSMATVERFDDTAHTWREDLHSLHGDRYWSLRVRERQIKARWHDPKPAAPKTPEPDLPLNDLLPRIYKKLGGILPERGIERRRFLDRVDREIANTAKLRGLHVWGYHAGQSAIEAITDHHWSIGRLDHTSGTLAITEGYPDPRTRYFTDLEFNQEEVERFWPSPLEDDP